MCLVFVSRDLRAGKSSRGLPRFWERDVEVLRVVQYTSSYHENNLPQMAWGNKST